MPNMLKKIFLLALVLTLGGAVLWAGDTASFVDLGFSRDGGIYMFAQYGVFSGTLKPWADLYVVDVAKNDFVPGGKVAYASANPVNAGNDGIGAFYRAVAQNTALTERYGIDFLSQGHPLYIALDADGGSAQGERIEFRDFERGFSYQAHLIPRSEGAIASLTTSFYINLDRTGTAGDRRNFTVGNPGVKRPQIITYKIKKVIVSPMDNSLVFVIETRKRVASGYDVRYMVETLRP
jgi:predicted secreted protein